jgi:hypothetical protein
VPFRKMCDCSGSKLIAIKGIPMPMRTIECSDRIVLACQCGERIVLLGRPVDWYDEAHLEFSCECGETLTLDDAQSVENPV